MNEVKLLLVPKWKELWNRLREDRSMARLKLGLMVALAVAFWCGSFALFAKLLAYFQSVEVFGLLVAERLLSMIFVTFFSMLILSNIITSLSTYFLSQDLQMLFSAPISVAKLYGARFIETVVQSSWMVLLFGLPVFLAYGVVLRAEGWYYVCLPVVVVPFLVIPAAVGVMVTMILVNVFPARRIKDLLLLMSIIFVVVLVLAFRFLQPEKLVDPEAFASMAEFLAALQAPTFPFLPSTWAVRALVPPLLGHAGETLFYVLMLVSTALALIVIGNLVSEALYFAGFSKAQEATRARLSKGALLDWGMRILFRPFHPATRALMTKDVKSFLRDTTQWSQLLLMLALVVLYLYNIKVLPLDKAPIATVYLKNMVSFLNLGLAGFVLSAIAVRFIFPSISLEGDHWWLLRGSPLSLRRLLWSKFWAGLVPLLVLAEVLVVLSNRLLHVSPIMMAVSTGTIVLMTVGIVALGVGMGAVFPRFHVESLTQISMGFGGIVYMIMCMAFIGAIVLLEASPVYLLFMEEIGMGAISPGEWAWIWGSFALVVVIGVVAVVLPMRIGHRKMVELEL